ncbi:MAG: AraC family transcriptional regulator [Pseudomonadota bacterium]
MPNRYQEIYPEPPKLKATTKDPLSAQNLLSLEYFDAAPGEMQQAVFDQHHILINLQQKPHRVENWRDSEHRDFIYHENEIILTPAGIASGWKWYSPSKVIVITLEPFAFEQFALHNLQIKLTREQLKDAFQFIDKDLTQSATMLRDALYSDVGSDVLFESFARVFLTKLIQSYGLERNDDYAFTRSFTSKHYKAVLDYVAKHYSQNIALETLAQQTHLSTYHFARLFKQTIGVTPHQFVIQYRIERAKQMLLEPSPILYDVALSCGFSDQAHFTRIFKQYEGATPKQYLNQ